jgi:hypothetical protein
MTPFRPDQPGALRLSVRTQDFQSCKRGSTPLGRAKYQASHWYATKYTARRRIPPHLQGAVGRLCNPPKERVTWLQKSLSTKELARANVAAKAVLMDFDRIIARAQGSLSEHPLRTELPDKEIEQIAAYQRTDAHRQQGLELFCSVGLTGDTLRKSSG